MIAKAEECGLVDQMEQLQMVENQKVYEKSIKILETYFELEQQQDIMEMLSQPTTQGQNMAESSSLFNNDSQSTNPGQNFHF